MANGGHVCIYHYLRGGVGLLDSQLPKYGLYGATVETSETIQLVGCLGKEAVVHHDAPKQGNDAAAIQQVVDLIDVMVGHIRIVFMATGAGHTKSEHFGHGHPAMEPFGQSLGLPLFGVKGAYIRLASSTLRFMYSAKSLEFIGDC